jgi:hypothetical protein
MRPVLSASLLRAGGLVLSLAIAAGIPACGGNVVVDAAGGAATTTSTPTESSSTGSPITSSSSGAPTTSSSGQTSTFASSTAASSSASSSTTAASSSSSSGSPPVTWTADAAPIFRAKCAPCHATGDSGGSDFATVYADTQRAPNASVAACSGVTTVGACTLIRIKNGSMPLGKGCTGNPTTDAGNAACLTQAQQNTIAAWISGGELQ